jgi:NitT/TauT family transport system substrate-binding protein
MIQFFQYFLKMLWHLKEVYIMKKMLFIGLAVLLISAIAFSGCLGKSTDIVIGYQPSTHQMAFTTAKTLGLWNELSELSDVTNISDRSFPTGPPEATALSSGAIQVAYIGAAPLLPAVAQNNSKLKIIAAVQINGSGMVVPIDADYTGPEYLIGKSIGTFGPGSIQDTLLKQWLIDNGISLSDVKIVEQSQADAQTALMSGAVDAVFLPHPAPSSIGAQGYGKVVMNSGEMEAGHACCVLAVSQDFIDAHPDVVREIVRIHIESTKYINENPEIAAKHYSQVTGVSEDIILNSINEWDGQWISDPNLIMDYVVQYAQIQYEQGLIPRPLTAEELFDTSFYDEYMKTK